MAKILVIDDEQGIRNLLDRLLSRKALALTTLDGSGNVGQYTSMTIGTDGLGLISYHDATNGNLKVAHCANRACTSATLTPWTTQAKSVRTPQ